MIGIGTLWDFQNNDLYTSGEFYKAGTNAEARWNDIGCTGRLPVETDGGPGTAGKLTFFDVDVFSSSFLQYSQTSALIIRWSLGR